MARPLRMAIADGWYHMFGRGVDWNGGRSSVKGEAWEQFADRRGDEGRDLFLWAARRFCGMSLSELGKAVGANFAAVSMAIKRLELRSAHDSTIRELQERAIVMLNV